MIVKWGFHLTVSTCRRVWGFPPPGSISELDVGRLLLVAMLTCVAWANFAKQFALASIDSA